MWVVETPPMSAATLKTCSSSAYQARSRLAGQREPAGRHRQEALSLNERQATLGNRPLGERQQCVGEQPSSLQETFEPALQILAEEAPVVGGQQRGEHPKRVGRELVAIAEAV